MADYFSVLQGAVGELDINTAAARRDIYDRARTALLGRLRSVEPQLPEPVIESELGSLNEAIERVETEHLASRGRFSRAASMAPGAGPGAIHTAPPDPMAEPRPEPPPRAAPRIDEPAPAEEENDEAARVLLAAGERPRRRILAPLLAAVAGLVLAIVVVLGALIYWPRHNRDAQAHASNAQSNASYVYLRQPVYFRTTHPPGTILIDKAQRFAYVVLPNVVALRYGIGVGPECTTAQGLYRILRKEEWPGRASDSGFGKIRNFFAGDKEENPLGARALYLQDYRLHGTNAPSGIGGPMPIGCIALTNDGITEFYDKAPLETRVVFLE